MILQITSHHIEIVNIVASLFTRYAAISDQPRPGRSKILIHRSKMKFQNSDGYVASDIVRLMPLFSLRPVKVFSE
jgi:hypothetical protein